MGAQQARHGVGAPQAGKARHAGMSTRPHVGKARASCLPPNTPAPAELPELDSPCGCPLTLLLGKDQGQHAADCVARAIHLKLLAGEQHGDALLHVADAGGGQQLQQHKGGGGGRAERGNAEGRSVRGRAVGLCLAVLAPVCGTFTPSTKQQQASSQTTAGWGLAGGTSASTGNCTGNCIQAGCPRRCPPA